MIWEVSNGPNCRTEPAHYVGLLRWWHGVVDWCGDAKGSKIIKGGRIDAGEYYVKGSKELVGRHGGTGDRDGRRYEWADGQVRKGGAAGNWEVCCSVACKVGSVRKQRTLLRVACEGCW